MIDINEANNKDLQNECSDQIYVIIPMCILLWKEKLLLQEEVRAAEQIDAPFTNCISRINNVLIDNAEDLDIVMLMNNLLEYKTNY